MVVLLLSEDIPQGRPLRWGWISRLSVVKESSAWTEHTYRVLQSTAIMLSGMVDQETGLRGYLIDGQDKFLEPYRNGTISFQEALKRTLELTADNPAQQARLADLERIATEWKRGHADRAIALAGVSATLEQGQKLEKLWGGEKPLRRLPRQTERHRRRRTCTPHRAKHG
jgi:methyl-accepting chemotaxis protein